MSRPGPSSIVAAAVLAIAVLATVVTASTAFAADEAEQGRCRARYDYLNRYEFSGGSRRDSGVKLRSEIARAQCEEGETEDGISILKEELRRALLPLPQGD